MNKENSEVMRQYLKELSEKLNCPKSVKSVFISELTGDIEEFAEDRGEITIADLYKEFGSPQDISDGFYDREDYKDLLEKAKKKLFKWRVCSAVAFVFTVILIALLIYMLKESVGYITVTDYGIIK